jgi:pimeloyl-ACP methyl ester carboxylesterase
MPSHRFMLLSLGLLALSLTAVLVACQKESDTSEIAPPAVVVDSVASPDGLMIHYDVRGQGDRTLVFVHCWTCDRTFWKNQVDVFARDYRVVSADLGGHGESPLGRQEWTMAAFGEDVASVVNKLDLKNIVLIGHSMGGPVIIEAARHLPGRVVGLIGVDNLQSLHQHIPDDQIAAFIANFQPDFGGSTRKFVASMFSATADSALVEQISDVMSSADPEMAMGAMNSLLRYDYATAMADMRLPIRTISSDKYPTDVEGNRQLAASFAVRLMPGQGHFPHLEDPAGFNRLLRETLADFWPEEKKE